MVSYMMHIQDIYGAMKPNKIFGNASTKRAWNWFHSNFLLEQWQCLSKMENQWYSLSRPWWFTSSLGITLEVEEQRVPQLARHWVTILMDLVLSLIFTLAQQHQINSCRIHLQVHMLSDITTADGTTILPEVIRSEVTFRKANRKIILNIYSVCGYF